MDGAPERFAFPHLKVEMWGTRRVHIVSVSPEKEYLSG